MKASMVGFHSAHNDFTRVLDFSVKPNITVKNKVVNLDAGL